MTETGGQTLKIKNLRNTKMSTQSSFGESSNRD